MGEQQPRISVVIATYAPGEGLDRVLDSLDAQTLPQDEFETIVVDDGSPDDTFERLQRAASTRPNMRIDRIENSGWPSRPRNLATRMARGEWVLFMDHDDSLYPDALRRAAEYAAETRADLLSPKESKTSDVWWGMAQLADGNIPDVKADGGIDRLLPMVPHKFYRREFLLEHGITFPEGRRMLWEDIYLNVEAYRKTGVVAVLADTPVYLWHSSATNNSKTYGPDGTEFWDRLEDLLVFIDATLDGEDFADARRSALLHQYRTRLLGRFGRMLGTATDEQVAMALPRARDLQQRFVPEEWDAHLGLMERARSALLRAGRPDLLRALHEVDADVRAVTRATEVAWVDRRLRVVVEAGWEHRSTGQPLRLIRRGDRVLRDLPPELARALGDDLLDVTDALASFQLTLGIRSRNERVTWQLPADVEVRWQDVDGGVTPIAHGTVEFDPESIAGGRPLDAPFWDCYATTGWLGVTRGGGIRSDLRAAPALIDGLAQVAYANRAGNLSLDRSQRLRNVVKDGRAALATARGGVDAFTLRLPGVHVAGGSDLPAAVAFVPEPGPLQRASAPLPAMVEVPGRVRGDLTGAHLTAGGSVPTGRYRLRVRVGTGAMLTTTFIAAVGQQGALDLHSEPIPPEGAPEPPRIRTIAREVRRRALQRIRRG